MTYALSFDIESTPFKDAVSWALKGSDSKDYILFNVAVHEGFLSVSSANMQSYFKDKVEVKNVQYEESTDQHFRKQEDKEVFFAVDAATLAKVSSFLPKGHTIHVDEKFRKEAHVLSLKRVGQVFELPLLKNKRPPKPPEITVVGDLLSNDLFYAVKSLAKISDTSGTSAAPAVGALDFTINEDKGTLSLMGTDTYVLSEVSIPFSLHRPLNDEDVQRFLVSSLDATLVVKDSSENNSLIEIGFDSNNKIAFLFGDNKVSCISPMKAEHFQYHNYQQKRDNESSFVVDAKSFLQAVKMSGNLSWDTDDVFLTLKNDHIVVTNEHNNSIFEIPFEEDSVSSVEPELLDVSINFLSSIIVKAMSPVNSKKIRVSFVGSQQFFRLSLLSDSGHEDDSVFILFVPVIKRGS